MAIASDTVELLKTVVAAGTPIDCALVTYDPTWINVYYGAARIQAVYSTDYSVTVALDFQSFTLTPTVSLVNKLNALGEGNNIRVVRFAPTTNDMTETDAFKREELVFQFDRVSMALAQLQYQFGFVPQDFVANIQAAIDAAAAALVSETNAQSSEDDAEAAQVAATASAATATAQAGIATAQAGAASGSAVAADASADLAAAILADIQAQGGTVLHGAGVPSNALGQNGWYYINDTLKELHGPKAAGVWPAGIAMTVSGSAVSGPGSSTNNAIATWNGAGGTVLKDSAVLISSLATLANPTFTGVPAGPTAAPGTNTTQFSTTAFVKAAIDVVLGGVSSAFDTLSEIATQLGLLAPLASPALTGNPTAPTQAANNNSTRLATTAYADTADALKANLASPVFTGNPTGPTPSPGDNDTSLATTAFVTAAIAAISSAWTMVKRTTDLTRINTAVTAADGTLQFAMAANTKYYMKARIIMNADADGDFKWGLSGPASPTAVTGSALKLIDNAQTTANFLAYPTNQAMTASGTTAVEGTLLLDFVIENGANAGNLTFDWAQNTSNGDNTTVKAGSHIEYTVI